MRLHSISAAGRKPALFALSVVAGALLAQAGIKAVEAQIPYVNATAEPGTRTWACGRPYDSNSNLQPINWSQWDCGNNDTTPASGNGDYCYKYRIVHSTYGTPDRTRVRYWVVNDNVRGDFNFLFRPGGITGSGSAVLLHHAYVYPTAGYSNIYQEAGADRVDWYLFDQVTGQTLANNLRLRLNAPVLSCN